MRSLLIIAAVVCLSFDTFAEPLSYAFEFQKKSYPSKETIEYPKLKVLAIRGTGELVESSNTVTVEYIGALGNKLGLSTAKMNIRACQRADLGEKCSETAPELNLSLFKNSCSLVFQSKWLKKEVKWGLCNTSDFSSRTADLIPSFQNGSDEDINIVLYNKGSSPTEPFRVLVVYLDNRGGDISYEFKNVERKILPDQEEVLSIEPSYLYQHACKLKIIVDPDSRSGTRNRDDHVLTMSYGECLDETFIPYEDLSLNGGTFISVNSDTIKIDVDISNNGDIAVSGRALEVKLEGFDAQKQPVLKDRIVFSGYLGPKEQTKVHHLIPKFAFDRSCTISLEVNATSSVNEFNKINNKTTINHCN
ncbi:hypothetical protein [Bdellovibrio sp. HCB-110]|uniref:hypothetical protein n=1 Tax=Bdellovibrio sp. HCB-110 TaxID=3391182 RepID=UPI0039B48AD3